LKYNEFNTEKYKFDYIYSQILDKQIDVLTLIEINGNFYKYINQKLQDSDYDYYPRNVEYANLNELKTITVFNKKVIESVNPYLEIDGRNKIIKLRTRKQKQF